MCWCVDDCCCRFFLCFVYYFSHPKCVPLVFPEYKIDIVDGTNTKIVSVILSPYLDINFCTSDEGKEIHKNSAHKLT